MTLLDILEVFLGPFSNINDNEWCSVVWGPEYPTNVFSLVPHLVDKSVKNFVQLSVVSCHRVQSGMGFELRRPPLEPRGSRKHTHSCLLHHCQPNISTVRVLWDCHPPASLGLEYPSPPSTASEAWTQPRPIDPAAPPRLLAPSPPPSPVDPPALPSSLVPPALPWSGVDLPSPRDSSSLAAPRRSDHWLRWAPSSCQLHLGPRSLHLRRIWRISRSPPPPQSLKSSASAWLIGSPPRAPPPPALPPLVGPTESAAIPPSWLLSPSAPPGVNSMAVAWVLPGSSCSGSLLSPVWLPPPRSNFHWIVDAPSGKGEWYHAPELFFPCFCSCFSFWSCSFSFFSKLIPGVSHSPLIVCVFKSCPLI